jgi:hypothetical protein
MKTQELVKYIRDNGCRVRLYNDRGNFADSSDGYFMREPAPLIAVATKNKSQNLIRLLLCHEYCHFLQWREGFYEELEKQYGTADAYYDWIEGRANNKKKALRSMKGVLLLEYDCELRALEFAKTHHINIGARPGNIRRINAYLANIKKDFEDKKCSTFYSTFGFSSKIPIIEQVLAPLTNEERRLLT